jgi:hypothetical protein
MSERSPDGPPTRVPVKTGALRAATDEVIAAYNQMPNARRPLHGPFDADGFPVGSTPSGRKLYEALEDAGADSDSQGMQAAIDAWRDHWLREFGEASR